jgi:hypothetical protein
VSAALPAYVFGELRVPTYHRFGQARADRELVTGCGLTISWWDAVSKRMVDNATRLRTDWAEQIGKPCTKCYRSRR